MASKLVLTVSQLNEYVRRVLQSDPMLHSVELQGEISNLKWHQNGMLYFTLKDEQAAIACVMYAQDIEKLHTEPFEGLRAVVSGSVSLYARGGQYQFTARTLNAQGVGVLYERLLALKTKLRAEGLFDSARKQPLPMFPDTVGVVSSPTGAVIHDILNVSLRRNPQARILLCPVRVQGVGAAQEVEEGIALLSKIPGVSVIIVARGGGSMEDLWTFNEERVVRAVARCAKPIVSAIGHETDVTLCDLAADLRAPTPSAAAECVVPVRKDVEAAIEQRKDALYEKMLRRLGDARSELEFACARLEAAQPDRRMKQANVQLAKMKSALTEAYTRQVALYRQQLVQKQRELMLLSPYAVLSRGYAIVQRGGQITTSAGALTRGDRIVLRFADGSVQAEVFEASESRKEKA